MSKNRRRQDLQHHSIPEKANFVLNCIMVGLFLIAFRIWHLQFAQYEEKFEESRKPQRRTAVESAHRATIRDRFNIPLAINKTTFKASIAYAPMRQIPANTWTKDEQGKRIKVPTRKLYITSLSELLAKELDLDPERVEDLIYSKAALYYNLPYPIKDEISESEYTRLKILQKDWPGLIVERTSKRVYPKGKCACDVVGYLGAISREEHESVLREIKGLKQYLTAWESGEEEQLPDGYQSPREVLNRVRELEELAYTTQDFVGKTGIEALFEEELRGFQGKRSYYADSKGNFLKGLPGSRQPLPGKRVLLSISQELQEYAEQLLAQNEEIRFAKISGHGVKATNLKQPWIKGGGIVVMDPKTGEILTLASYPRFDPNDFIPSAKQEEALLKQKKIRQWFESEAHIADLWDRKIPLDRERYDEDAHEFYLEERPLTWTNYLEFILPEQHPIRLWFAREGSIRSVINVLNALESEQDPREWIKTNPKELDSFPTVYTKLLFLDCCQLAIDKDRFSPELLKVKGAEKIEAHREAEGAWISVLDMVKNKTKSQFHELIFKRWRKENERAFLKEKREIEKLTKSYPKPYIDYLDEKEAALFAQFWDKSKWELALALLKGSAPSNSLLSPFTDELILTHKEIESGAHQGAAWADSYHTLKTALQPLSRQLSKEYLLTLRSYNDLNRPLLGKYKRLRSKNGPALEKHLAAAFYPTYGFGYGRSNGYRQAATPGSIFKLITSYQALMQTNAETMKNEGKIKHFNPLDITDRVFKIGKQTHVGLTASGKPIPQLYKGGRIPRSSIANIGKTDLKYAIETSSNLYFALLAGELLNNPNDLIDAAKLFGYGSKTGIDLPGEISGRLPQDLETNRTGLYATAIGQHSFVATPIQTAVMLSSLANGGELLKPQVIHALAGTAHTTTTDWFYPQAHFRKKAALQALGIDFPLLENDQDALRKGAVERQIRMINKTVLLPAELREFLFESMYRVVLRTHAHSLSSLSKLYANHPEAISDYIDLKTQLIGKTSTSEAMERIDLDENEGTNLYTHLWFGGISFEEDVTESFDKPELVVVVYLKYGNFGKEAAPVAAQMIRKWREIKERHAQQ